MTTTTTTEVLHPRVVLVASDLSPTSAEALHQGHRIAQRYSARLVVAHVRHDFVGINPLFPQLTMEELQTQQSGFDELHEALARAVALATGRDGEEYVDLQVSYGEPASEILALAKRCGAELIVLGDSGARGIGRIGRTSTKVLRGAAVPVLIARASAATDVTLAATDFSDPSLPALRAASAYADGRLLLFHNVEPPIPPYAAAAILGAATPLPVRDDHRVLHALDRLRSEAVRLGSPSANAHVSYGDEPASEILAMAHAAAAELIVVGTHGRGLLGRLFHGSVSERVAHEAMCSVLVVRLAHSHA